MCIGGDQPVQVLTDHNNLRYFQTTKKLSPRQARWSQELSAYDFVIEHRPGKENPADGFSRRPDYDDPNMDAATLMLPTLQQKLLLATVEEPDRTITGPRTALDQWVGLTLDGMRREWLHPTQLVAVVGAVTPRYSSDDDEDTGTEEEADEEEREEAHQDETLSFISSTGPKRVRSPSESGLHLTPRALVGAAATKDSARGSLSSPEALLAVVRQIQRHDGWVKAGGWKDYTTTDGPLVLKPWALDNQGTLRYEGAAYVPRSEAVRQEILLRYHDDPWTGGHLGYPNTLHNIRRNFFWPTMVKDIKNYCKTCDICQRTKPARHKPFGDLKQLLVPAQPMKEFSMDFITGLPPALYQGRDVDMILVIVDRKTKYSFYFAVNQTMSAEDLAALWVDRFADYGPPSGIVTDRGSIFTSKFWSAWCYYLKTKQRLSTAFHPQTDGQTERQNQNLEHYLRCYVNECMDDWPIWLPLAQSVYNRKQHNSIGMSPFEALHGYVPDELWSLQDESPFGEVPAAKLRVSEIVAMRDRIHKVAHDARVWQAAQANKQRTPQQFEVGQMVLLSAKNIKTKRAKPKLDFRYLGPFTVTERIGSHAYRLDLPLQYPIHDVFHVSLLEPYHRRSGSEPPDPQEIAGELEWNVEKIVGVRGEKKRQFKVRWEGWAPAHDSWEPEENLVNAREAVNRFLQNIGQKPLGTRGRLRRNVAEQPQRKRGRPRRGENK
jgi:hypothetical protein